MQNIPDKTNITNGKNQIAKGDINLRCSSLTKDQYASFLAFVRLELAGNLCAKNDHETLMLAAALPEVKRIALKSSTITPKMFCDYMVAVVSDPTREAPALLALESRARMRLLVNLIRSLKSVIEEESQYWPFVVAVEAEALDRGWMGARPLRRVESLIQNPSIVTTRDWRDLKNVIVRQVDVHGDVSLKPIREMVERAATIADVSAVMQSLDRLIAEFAKKLQSKSESSDVVKPHETRIDRDDFVLEYHSCARMIIANIVETHYSKIRHQINSSSGRAGFLRVIGCARSATAMRDYDTFLEEMNRVVVPQNSELKATWCELLNWTRRLKPYVRNNSKKEQY